MNDSKGCVTSGSFGKRVMIAAPMSGCGKTTITCGLMQALKSRGYRIAAAKCGPDYIDPMFHRKVLGVDSPLTVRGQALMRWRRC